MTFTNLSANENNFIRVKIPVPPVELVCLKVNKVFSSCRKTSIIAGCWRFFDDPNPPSPFPPEKILNFFLFEPVITELYSFYSKEHRGFFISLMFSLHLTVLYLDTERNRCKLHLSHKGEAGTWLESPSWATVTATIFNEVLSCQLKKEEDFFQDLLGKTSSSTNLCYTIGLSFDFLSLQKIKVLVPSFGYCLPLIECSSPEIPGESY